MDGVLLGIVSLSFYMSVVWFNIEPAVFSWIFRNTFLNPFPFCVIPRRTGSPMLGPASTHWAVDVEEHSGQVCVSLRSEILQITSKFVPHAVQW
jgi:hypothetical protein